MARYCAQVQRRRFAGFTPPYAISLPITPSAIFRRCRLPRFRLRHIDRACRAADDSAYPDIDSDAAIAFDDFMPLDYAAISPAFHASLLMPLM